LVVGDAANGQTAHNDGKGWVGLACEARSKAILARLSRLHIAALNVSEACE